MSIAEAMGEELERIISRRLADNSLVLPTLPVVATQVLAQLRDTDVSTRAIATTLEKDPLLCAQVLRSANSAVHGMRPVATPEQALLRLGAAKTKALLVAACAHRVFVSRDPKIQRIFAGHWEHSLAVGVLARDLCALSGSANADEAFVAGVLHDIGKPILGSYLLQLEKDAAMRRQKFNLPAATWTSVVDARHRSIGLRVLERWQIAEPVVQAVQNLGDFDPGNRHTVANYVRFANAMTKSLGIYVGTPSEDESGALVMVGRSLLGLDDESVARVTTDLRERVARMMK